MTLPRLWSISYSPWSDKARWALDHCEVAYRRRSFRPIVDELALRRALGSWTGPVSVPILQLPDEVLAGSWDIATWADGQVARDELRIFPARHEAALRRYDALSEAALAAGRTLGLRCLLDEDGDGLLDLVPRAMRSLGPIARRVAAAGVRRTIRKYAPVTPTDLDAAQAELLEALRADLSRAAPGPDGARYLLGTFSYADIVMAEAVAFISPPATHLRLTAASRRAYLREDLASRYPDVVAWRDELYARRKA